MYWIWLKNTRVSQQPESYETDTKLEIYADFGIPKKIDVFVEELDTEIVNYQYNAQDITDDYYDVMIRLDTAEVIGKYYEFCLMQKMEDIVYIQGEIDRLTEDIELLQRLNQEVGLRQLFLCID